MKFIYTAFLLLFFLPVNAQNFIIHKVQPKETLYGIAKQYNTTIDIIYKNNPSLTPDNLKMGTELRIPQAKVNQQITNTTKPVIPAISKTDTASPRRGAGGLLDTILHQVKPKETMYAISKLYHVTMGEIQIWNNLPNTDLQIDMIVKIVKPANSVEAKNNITAQLNREETQTIISNTTTADKIKEQLQQAVKEPATTNPATKPDPQATPKTETVVAPKEAPKQDTAFPKDTAVIKPLSLSEQFDIQLKTTEPKQIRATGAPMKTNNASIANTFFALHKTAKIGSIIKVKNLENDKISYAKVIGKLPEIDENKKIVVRLSLGVTNAIKMGNGKAYLEMEFVE
jgi:LysM repeat protein